MEEKKMEKLGKGETVVNTFVSIGGIAEKRKKKKTKFELYKLKKNCIWEALILCCNFL